MTLKNNWANGDVFTPAAANDMANVVNTFEQAAVGITGVYVAGADRTGATDSLSVLQGIINSAAAGSTIYFPGGTFLISGPLVIDKPLVIRGGGGMFKAANQGGTWPGVAGTNIVTTSATANAINITSSGVVIEDIAVVNTRALASPPTAGSGIFMNNANNFRLSRVTVAGFYDNIRAEGRFGNIDSCNIFDPVRYGVYFFNDNSGEDDFGDQGICNSNIAMYGRQTDGEAAIRWESGGGIRFTGNKIVAWTGPGATSIGHFNFGIDIMVDDTAITGEFEIAGGAISTCKKACLRVGQKNNIGTNCASDITVTGVIFQGSSGFIAGTKTHAIVIGAQSAGFVNSIRSMIVTGCTFKGVPEGGIVAYNMRGLVIGPNLWQQNTYTGPLITLAGSSPAGTDNGVSTQQVDVYRQTIASSIQDQSITVVKDNRGFSTVGSLDGFVEYNYKRNVYRNATGWATMYTIEPPDNGGAGFIEVTLSGQDYGVTRFAKRIRRSFLKNNSTVGGAITIATSGTDENIGSTTYVGLQVIDGGSGKIQVQVAMLTGGTTVWGDIEVNVSGRVQKFSIGAGI